MAVSYYTPVSYSPSYPFLLPPPLPLLTHRHASSSYSSYSPPLPSSSSSPRKLHVRHTCAASGVDAKPEVKLETRPMLPPYNVLITGSTKGIGYALAREFLKAGDNVIVCSRSAERVQEAVSSLRNEFGEQHVWGTTCDVRNGQDVKSLVAYAQKNLKHVDIWVTAYVLLSGGYIKTTVGIIAIIN